jgi:hypothetical protein
MITPEDASAIWADLPELMYQSLRDWLMNRTNAGPLVPATLDELREQMLYETADGDPELAALYQRLTVLAVEFIERGAHQLRLDRPDFDLALGVAIPDMEPVWLEDWEVDHSLDTPIPGMARVYAPIHERERGSGG